MDPAKVRLNLVQRYETLSRLAESEFGHMPKSDSELKELSDSELRSEIKWLETLTRTPHR